MGKQGPCCHCGISTTPLWRNGPPEKPVLCNACGSRWKTKGTLLNYMPMHSGGFGANLDASGDGKWSRAKKGSHKHTDNRSLKRKDPFDGERASSHFRADQSFAKVHVEEAVSRSLSGSGMSSSEGPVRRTKGLKAVSPVLRAPVPPKKKRSASLRVKTPVDKLRKLTASLFVNHEPVAHSVPEASSEALLDEYTQPSLGAIGRGGVWVGPSVSLAQEPESGITSIFSEFKRKRPFNVLEHSEFSGGPPFYVNDKYLFLRGKDKAKQVPGDPGAEYLHNDKIPIANKPLIDKCPPSKRDFLASAQSPLKYLEMKDIVNYDTFTGLLTEHEQGQLMQLLSSADVARVPESLKTMFSSTQLESALANFQHLLSEGLFDSSESGLDPRVLQHFQQLLSLTDLAGSGWMERACQLQNRNKRRGSVDGTKAIQPKDPSKEKLKGPSLHGAAPPVSSGPAPRQLPSRSYDKVEDSYKPMKSTYFVAGTSSSASPTEFYNSSPVKHEPISNSEIGISSNEAASLMEGEAKIDSTFFLGGSPFHSALGKEPLIGDDYLDLGGIDSNEADSLLFDVPNHMSFQQAELLQQPPSSHMKPKFMKEDENEESGGLIMSNTWHTDPDPPSLLWNSSFGPAQALPNGTVLNPSRKLL